MSTQEALALSVSSSYSEIPTEPVSPRTAADFESMMERRRQFISQYTLYKPTENMAALANHVFDAMETMRSLSLKNDDFLDDLKGLKTIATQNAAALIGFRKGYSGLESKVGAVEKEICSVTLSLGSASRMMGVLQADAGVWVESIKGQITSLTQTVGGMSNDIRNCTTLINGLGDHFGGMQESLEDVIGRCTKIERGLKEVEDSVAGIDRGLSEVEGRVGSMEETLGRVEKNQNAMMEKLTAVLERVNN